MPLTKDNQQKAIALLHKLDPAASEFTLSNVSLKTNILNYNKRNPSTQFTPEEIDLVSEYQAEIKACSQTFNCLSKTNVISESLIQNAKEEYADTENYLVSKQNQLNQIKSISSTDVNITIITKEIDETQKNIASKKAALEQINLYQEERKKLKTPAPTPAPSTTSKADDPLSISPGTPDPAKPKETPEELMKRWNDSLSTALKNQGFSMQFNDPRDPSKGLGIFKKDIPKAIIEVTNSGLTVSPSKEATPEEKAALVVHTALTQGWPKDKPITLKGGSPELREAVTKALQASHYKINDVTNEATSEKKSTEDPKKATTPTSPFPTPTAPPKEEEEEDSTKSFKSFGH